MTLLSYITFATTTNMLVLPVPEYGNSYEAERRQKIGRSDGGTLYVYDKGAGGLYRQALTFRDLTKFEAADLRLFFDTVSVGAQTTFTFTDHRSRTATARFLNTTLQFENSGADDRYHISILLEVSAISDISLSHPLLICNMESDVDDTGRHGIIRGTTLSYATDYYKWVSSLRCNSAGSGDDTYRFIYFQEDMDLTRYKRTMAFWMWWGAGLTSGEPFYAFRHVLNGLNYWEVKFQYSGAGTNFTVSITTVIAGVTTTDSKTVSILSGVFDHYQFEFDPFTPQVKLFVNGTLSQTYTGISVWPFWAAGTNYMKIEGDYWRIDSYAWFQGLKNNANFTPPTGPYTP